jgi:hypothetical protein
LRDKKFDKELLKFAKKALHGLEDSDTFVGILNDGPLTAARAEFLLQLGHCVLSDKPIIIPVPFGVEIPKKLAAIADCVVRYDVNNPKSLTDNLAHVLAEMGINKQ